MTASLSTTSTKETLVSVDIPGPLTKSPTLGIPLLPLYKNSRSAAMPLIVYTAVIGLGVGKAGEGIIVTAPEE